VIRIERVPLPDGLRALAHRDPHGGMIIYVSSTLDARKQRTAIMAAVRASRRAGRRTAVPLGIALLLALRLCLPGLRSLRGTATTLHRGAALALHVRPVAWVAVGTAVATGAVVTGLVLSTPAHPRHSAGPPTAGRTGQPPAGPGRRPGDVRPAAGIPTVPAGAAAGQPQAARHSLAAQSPTPVSSVPTSAPAPASSATPSPSPSPSPSPLPSPTSGAPGTCVIILGLLVCVPVSVSVSASVGG
jgi:hypothetical protein